FYFINEHVLRFLNLRYPRDYNTVPRVWFWLFHILWFFPWSLYLPALLRRRAHTPAGNGDIRVAARKHNVMILALAWCGVVLGFFTFSTTQEYYSMPCYPAIALLLGCALATPSPWHKYANRIVACLCAVAAIVIAVILWQVRSLPTPGDISVALTQNPDIYT